MSFVRTGAALIVSLAAAGSAASGALAQSTFSGPYAGAAIGYGITELSTEKTVTVPPPPITVIGSSVDGIAGTIFAGYNLSIAPRTILGVEADATWSHWTGTFHNDDYEVDWNASVRARLGYELRPDLLAYVTGGVGWMHLSVSPNHTGDFDKTLAGYVVGGGLEYTWLPQARLRLEYLYSNYRSWSFDPTPLIHEKVDPEAHQFRIGLVIPLQRASEPSYSPLK